MAVNYAPLVIQVGWKPTVHVSLIIIISYKSIGTSARIRTGVFCRMKAEQSHVASIKISPVKSYPKTGEIYDGVVGLGTGDPARPVGTGGLESLVRLALVQWGRSGYVRS